MNEPQRISLRSAASFLGITERHLRELVYRRQITHYKIGGRLVFDVLDLDSFLNESRRPARGPR
jgi:excisionase family DNA binding protein